MLNHSIGDKIRHIVKKLPFSSELYDFVHTVFVPSYAEDGMRLSKNCHFLEDNDFKSAYAAALNQEPGTKTRWRAHVLQWAGFHASKLDGDFVETGVNKAFFSSSVIKYIKFYTEKNKKFYLFDTYEGLIEDLIDPSEKAACKNEYSNCYDFVVETFREYANVVIVKGIVPYCLSSVDIKKVAYLSVDMNCAKPEREALEYFWPKIVAGGIIILDDYAFPGRQLQQQSADEFASSVNVKVLCLPTGQGIIIKPFQ